MPNVDLIQEAFVDQVFRHLDGDHTLDGQDWYLGLLVRSRRHVPLPLLYLVLGERLR